MALTYKRIAFPAGLEAFYALDRIIFSNTDPLPASYLGGKDVYAYWIMLSEERIGAVVVECDVTVADTIDQDSVVCPGSLHVVSIGILPAWRRRYYALKCMRWLVTTAPFLEDITRVVYNTRASNFASELLAIDAGFRLTETKTAYYRNPVENSLVYEYLRS